MFVPEFVFFGNFIMWALFTLVWTGSLLYLVENSHVGWATFTVAVTLVFLQVCTTFQPLTLAWLHPTSALGYIVLYLVAGIAVGIFKWWRFTANVNTNYQDAIDTMLLRDGKKFSELDKKAQDAYLDSAEAAVTGHEYSYPLHLYQHKARITTWMTYWPITGLYTLIKDPIRSFYTYSYQQITGTLQAIADRAQARVKPEYIRKP